MNSSAWLSSFGMIGDAGQADILNRAENCDLSLLQTDVRAFGANWLGYKRSLMALKSFSKRSNELATALSSPSRSSGWRNNQFAGTK